MASKTNIFVDTSWFKALADPTDDFHIPANQQYQQIKQHYWHLVTTNFVLNETFTLIRVKVDLQSALDFRKTLLSMRDTLQVFRVLAQDEKNSWKWFPNNWSGLSFTDCTSFAVMQRLSLTRVATFDQHFQRSGFKLL